MSSTRPKSGPLARTDVRNLANYRSLLPLLLVATVAVALVLIPSAILPARAVGTPAVFVAPLVHASVAKGAIVNFWVNVSNMPAFNGFNVMVKVDPAQLSPTSISTTAIMFATPSEDKNCVNDGAGIPLGMPGNIGCVVGLDGPGIAHEEVFCLGCFTTSDHGLLFNVTFTGVATSPTGSVVDLYNDQVFTPPIQAAHNSFDAMYGTARPDYTITTSPFSQSIPQRGTGVVSLTLQSVNSFTGTVTLNNASIPLGLPVTFSASNVTLTSGGSQAVTAMISPTASNLGGAYDLILNSTGPSPLSIIHPTSVSITVTVPDFSIVASRTSLVTPLGSSNSSTLTLTSINTFTGKVTISFTVSPIVANSPSITLTNSSHTGSSVTVDLTSGGSVTAMLTVTCTTSTATNSYSIRVTGVSGSLSRSTSVSVSVVPFSISASPVSVSLTSSTGSFATSTLTITSLATSHIDVTLSSSVSPSTTRPLAIRFANATTPSPGVPTLIEGVAAGGTSSLTLNVTVSCSGTPSVCTAVSTYTVKVTGTVGTASRFVNVAAMVTATSASDFTISATSPVNFNAGATGASTTVTVTAVGSFSGAVPLAPSVTPSTGLTVTCPPSVTLPPSPATASCTFSSTTPGVYGVSITGAGGGHTHSASVTVHVGDFLVSATSPSGTAGSSISSTVTLTRTQNFVGSVALSDTPLPAGLTCNPFTVTPGWLAANCPPSLTVVCGAVTGTCAPSSTTPGTYLVTVTGTGGGHTHTASFVSHVGDFSISVSSPVNFNSGATGSSISVSLTSTFNFAGTIGLTPIVSPAGLTVTCPAPVSITANATVAASCTLSSTTAGTYGVAITGAGSPGTASHSAASTVHVGNFTISVGSPVNFNSGATGSAISVSLTSTFNFAGTVALTPVTSPVTGLTVTCPAPVSITANATVAASCTLSSTTAGTYGVTITGAGLPGTASHSAASTVHVGDFTISATSPSGAAGSSISSTITLTSTFNFAGSVALSDTVPAGLSCNPFPVTPVSLTANSTGTSSLSCTSPTVGTFIVNISGVGTPGTTSHSTSATFTFTVGADFSITATSPADFNTGATGSSTVAITPSGGFTGAVSFTTVVSPATGLAANCPTSLTVVSGAVTGTCAPSSSTPGTYLVTITGTGGGHTHSTSFISHVGDFTISVGSPVNFTSGATGSSISVSLTSTFNFAGTVALTPVISPATGLTVACPAPVSITANATVAASCTLASTTAGTYGVTITGAGSPGSASHSASFVVHVGNFTISVGSPVNFNSGATGSAISVSLTSSFNFAGTATLTPVTSPTTGLTVTCPAPVSITANATVAASCTLSSTTAGTYGVSITGAGSPGTASHSASSPVHVGDFTITATSPSGPAVSSIRSTITLTSTFNFVGSVALSDTPLPAGLTCNPFTVTPVSLAANGTGTSSLSCTSTTANAFTVTITGTGSPGTASQSTTATFTFAIVSNGQLSSVVTDGSLCGFGDQFHLIFVQSNAKSKLASGFTLAASNPGQFAYNVFFNGTAGTPVTLSMSVPYPFVTQGTNPVQVFSNFGLQSGCFVPINNVSNSFAITPAAIALTDYSAQALGSTVTITVSGSVDPRACAL